MGASETANSLTNSAPPLCKSSGEEVVAFLQSELEQEGWQAQPGTPGVGAGMTRLFGRLADLVITRLNQAPENHFRAFLETAGVDLLPPQPAKCEITFYPAKDAPSPLRVPGGTQVAAKKSDSRPEVIFETERDLNVIKGGLETCIVIDPIRISVRSGDEAALATESFAVCQGDSERPRLLYFGDDGLFDFPDDPSRLNGTVILDVTLAVAGSADSDGWTLQWLYFDGKEWRDLVDEGGAVVADATDSLSQSGRIMFSNLPKMAKFAFDKEHGAWLACSLTSGTGRDHLPALATITAGREILIPNSPAKPVEAAFSAIHSGAAFIPLEPEGEFFPLGQRPGRLDSFYLKCDEAFAKQGAEVLISFDLSGVPATAVGQELTELRVIWEYCSAQGWITIGESSRSSVLQSLSGFDDKSLGFTAGGKGVTVSFAVPTGADRARPLWAKSSVADQEGLWLRARVTAGGYGTDPSGTTVWSAPAVLAPSIGNLKLSYGGFSSSAALRPLATLYRSLDNRLDCHSFAGAAGQFSPFSGNADFPAIYLGFSAPFPANEWLQILLDVDEERNGDREFPLMIWEYRSAGSEEWQPLPASDESAGFTRRGYLGFNAPADLNMSREFGRELYWLRARAHVALPKAVAPAGISVSPGAGNQATISLDASGSYASDSQRIVRYYWRLKPHQAQAGADIQVSTIGSEAQVQLDASATAAASGRDPVRYSWRLVSSSKLIARAGNDLVVSTDGGTATVTIDCSGSIDTGGGAIAKYILRKVLPEAVVPLPTPYLRGIRCNTVPAVNGTSMAEELLGSGNGKPGAVFTLGRVPVLPELKIYVRECDRPPATELAHLAREHAAPDGTVPFDQFPLTVSADQGVWVLWRRVENFYSSTPSDRHFVLEQITGRLLFGDGARGMIPPIARDNIKAAWYRSHQGGTGNVPAGAVTVVRNPAGQLAAVKRVANLELAVGGGNEESVAQVRERGPRTIKHRGRAVTIEDYAWMARDAGREVAAAWCLPTRDPDGNGSEGWVTVVIVPGEAGTRPYPRPPLLRHVRAYLEARALANLHSERHILVTGPRYIEIQVTAAIVPILPEKGDEVKLKALKRLEEFLHPLTGGTGRSGWELGREVYLSEVYAELEGVAGVDHVAELALDGSLQQLELELLPRQSISHNAPRGSRVGTIDDRLRLVLADPLAPLPQGSIATGSVKASLYGFRVGETVHIVDSANRNLLEAVTVCGVSRENDAVTIRMPFHMTENLPPVDSLALLSTDGSVRLPLTKWEDGKGVTVARTVTVQPGKDRFCIVTGGERYPEFEFMAVLAVARRRDRISIPMGHLACSGSHDIEMVLGD
jgi:hypothetical protein